MQSKERQIRTVLEMYKHALRYNKDMVVCVCVCVCVSACVYLSVCLSWISSKQIYIYIYREREREHQVCLREAQPQIGLAL